MVESTLLIYCENCSTQLNSSCENGIIYVDLCKNCLEEINKEFYNDVYNEGYAQAIDDNSF